MAWVKIDDQFYDHPKWRTAPGESIALWVAAIAWCNRARAYDGRIPTVKLHGLITLKSAKRTIADLEARNALARDGDDHLIHEYTVWQSVEKAKAVSEARAAAGRKGAETRWGGKDDGKQDGNSHRSPDARLPTTNFPAVISETDDLSDTPAGSVGRQELAELAARRLWPQAQAAKGISPMRMNAWITGTASNMLREREADIVRARASGMTVAAALELLTSIPAPNRPSRPAFYIDQDCQICEGEGLEPLGNNTFAPCPCRRSEPYEATTLASVSALGGRRKGAAS